MTRFGIHFEITGDPSNLIGSQQCDLFTNQQFFASFSQPREWNTKTKQPIRFQGLFKVASQIAGKPVRFIHKLHYFLL